MILIINMKILHEHLVNLIDQMIKKLLHNFFFFFVSYHFRGKKERRLIKWKWHDDHYFDI